MAKQKVIVIGAGVAGISSAMDLSRSGFDVTVLESREFIGGRMFSFTDGRTGDVIDNGQHAVIGAYHSFLRILDELGTINKLESQKALKVQFMDSEGQSSVIDTSKLWGNAGLLYGFMRFNSISRSEKFKAILFFLKVKAGLRNIDNITVHRLLLDNNQSENIIAQFWEPYTLSTMNTRIDRASAKLFVDVLKTALLSGAKNSKLMIPKTGLSELIAPFGKWLSDRGGKLKLNNLVNGLIVDKGKCIGVARNSGDNLFTDHVVSCVPPYALHKIIKGSINRKFFKIHTEFRYSPIVSVYLWLDRDITENKFTALAGTTSQWIFNRRRITESTPESIGTYPGLVQVTISAANDLLNLKSKDIAELCHNELSGIFPKAMGSKLLHHRVVKEKRATIKQDIAMVNKRPEVKTGVKNFFVAGDWANTGLPATLESAAVSGMAAANEIIGRK